MIPRLHGLFISHLILLRPGTDRGDRRVDEKCSCVDQGFQIGKKSSLGKKLRFVKKSWDSIFSWELRSNYAIRKWCLVFSQSGDSKKSWKENLNNLAGGFSNTPNSRSAWSVCGQIFIFEIWRKTLMAFGWTFSIFNASKNTLDPAIPSGNFT